jgi:hypothetical protein
MRSPSWLIDNRQRNIRQLTPSRRQSEEFVFTTLGQLIVRRRRAVLVTTLLGLIVAIVLGSGVFAGLTNGGFDDPASESTRAIGTLDDEFDTGSAELVVIVTARAATSTRRKRSPPEPHSPKSSPPSRASTTWRRTGRSDRRRRCDPPTATEP